MPGRLINQSTGKGKVVVVTGGGSGIGAATVYRLAQEGARIAILDLPRQKEGAHALMKQIRDEIPGAPEVIYLEIDVRYEDQWSKAMAAVDERFGPIDAMINNAGLDASSRDDLEDVTLAKWNRNFDVNVGGVFLGTKFAIRSMKKNPNPESKSIVNTASIAAVVGGLGTGSAPYSSSKGAVRIFTKSSAMYCCRKGYNIRVNSVHPGVIDTPGTRGMDLGYRTKLTELTPMGRFGKPVEIANAMLFLVSDESSFMTGSEVHVDGGFLAQ